MTKQDFLVSMALGLMAFLIVAGIYISNLPK